MVHILLTILKITGIVLAVLLLVLLLLILTVLFGPIRYRAEGQADRQGTLYGKASVSYIFFFVRCTVEYLEKQFLWSIRIFGILIASSEIGFRFAKKKKTKKPAVKEKQEQPKTPVIEEEKLPKPPENPTKKVQEKPQDAEAADEKKTAVKIKTKESAGKKKKKSLKDRMLLIKEKVKQLISKIRALPERIKEFKQNLSNKAEQFGRYKDFLLKEENKKVFSYLLGKLKKMAFHILPREIRGRVEFGLSDPYLMGQVLALLGIFYPVYQEQFMVIPDFEEVKLNGELSLKGRIIPGYLLLQCLLPLFKKEVRRVVREGRKLTGGQNNGNKK